MPAKKKVAKKTATKRATTKRKSTAKRTTTKRATTKRKATTKRTMKQELKRNDFRVSIFGSARTKKNDEVYKQVFEFAKMLGEHKIDVVTGGGPGLMEAANAGHAAGDPDHNSDSIGLTIQLPFEAEGNKHLEIKKHFNKFSGRLDHFMALSNAVVVMPGGIGTALELFYTWQLVQVKHMPAIPIVVVGKMWARLIKWVVKWQVKQGYVSAKDLKNIYIAKNNKQAMEIVMKAHKVYEKKGKNSDKYCKTIHRYQLD